LIWVQNKKHLLKQKVSSDLWIFVGRVKLMMSEH